MKKDIQGFLNTVMGVVIALLTGIYGAEIPSTLFWVLISASSFLIMRECWVFGGRVKWSFEPINRD